VKTLLSQIGMKFFVLSAAALFLAGSLGFSHFGMEMEVGREMLNCPFMLGQAAICTMNPLEHIAVWQNMFTALARESILVFLVFASLFPFFVRRLLDTSHNFSAPALYMVRRRVEIPIVLSPLEKAFSRGILHPKIF